MIYTFVHLFLICTIVSRRSISARNILFYPKLYSYVETKYPDHLSNQRTDNLLLILNFIQNTGEFRPLVFSIVQPEFQSSFINFLTKYIADNSIGAYTVRSRDLSGKTARINRVKSTWVILVRDLTGLYIYIHWQPRLWKSGNQYLIVFLGEDTIVSWRDVFRAMWKRYSVYRAVIVSVGDDFRCLIKYMPFDKYGDDFGAVYKLCTSDLRGPWKTLEDIDDTQQLNTTNFFENFQNLRNYPMNVLAFESLLMNITYGDQNRPRLSKLDSNVLYTLEKAMRARFLVKAMRKRDFRPEDPFSVSLRSIQNGNAEMVITGFFTKLYDNFQDFRFTSTVYEDRLCFLAPDSGLVPKAYMPFLPFHKQVWFLLMIYNVAITIVWFLINHISLRLRRPRTSSTDPKRSFKKLNLAFSRCDRHGGPAEIPRHQGPPEVPGPFRRLFVFLEALCYPLHRGSSLAQNCLLPATLFFSLVLNGLYQSCLVSSLNKPFHYPQLSTLEDVVNSGKPVITKYANLKTVFLDDSPIDRKLNERIRVISSKVSTKDIVAFQDKISITRYYGMVLGNYSYSDLLHVVEECPMNYRVAYVLRLDSPYAERVDFLLLRIGEAGLVSFWFQRMLYPVKIARLKRKLEIDKRKMKLSLDHYSLTFLLLFGGLVCSGVLFFCEFYAGWCLW